ncbi:MAG TPA: hypothetical protein DCQ50_19170 [Chryseobacterium sp.]|nr:hypothetical protein [Chryseobacterium sp.]
MNYSKIIYLLLFVSAINLTLMVPGGFIESRDFSHISPVVLGSFNVFLTTLGMLSLFLIYFIYKKQKWAFITAFFCGLSYFVVYTIDLAKIFPQSPTRMPTALFLLESLGTLLSIPLIYYTVKEAKEFSGSNNKVLFSKSMYWIIGIAICIGLGIIIFATKAAMTGK